MGKEIVSEFMLCTVKLKPAESTLTKAYEKRFLTSFRMNTFEKKTGGKGTIQALP